MNIYRCDNLWFRKCPGCGKELKYMSENNALKAMQKEARCQTCCRLGSRNPFYKRTHSDVFKKKMSNIHLGTKHSEETKIKIGLNSGKTWVGRKHSEETKRKMRSNLLRKFESSGIGQCIDVGATQFFEKYNKENDANFQPRRFIDLGYDADGYDENLHSWIEYDTKYHKKIGQQKKDVVRQKNIIQYFENIGNPLKKFLRVDATNNEEAKVIYE